MTQAPYLRRMFYCFFVIPIFCLASGCAIMESTPTPHNLFKHPLGTDSVKIGMSKSQVISLYGQPDIVTKGVTTKPGVVREKWVYQARYTQMPIDSDYLSKTRALYFDGDSLTDVQDE